MSQQYKSSQHKRVLRQERTNNRNVPHNKSVCHSRLETKLHFFLILEKIFSLINPGHIEAARNSMERSEDDQLIPIQKAHKINDGAP